MNPAVYRMYRQWQRRGLNVTGKNYEGFYRAMRIYEADYRRVAARYMGLR
jgi:hypothetical protein